jgi:hypothetical protein
MHRHVLYSAAFRGDTFVHSSFKVIRGTKGYEEVLLRANELVTRIGLDHLIAINTVLDPSESYSTGMGSGVALGADPKEIVVIVWYWEPER